MWLELVDEFGVPHLLNLDNIDNFIRATDPDDHTIKLVYQSGRTGELKLAWGELAQKIIALQYKNWGCM